MARALVIYATQHGQTRRVAERIASVLAARGHTAELHDAAELRESLPLDRFDRVFIGAPILAGGYPRAIRRFVRAHRDALAAVPTAFFSVGLSVASRTHDGRAQSREVVDRFLERTGLRPAHVELVAGALPYTRYNFLIRFVMRRIAEKEGGDTDTSRDYEYTDWAAVERFAESFMAASAEGPGRAA